MGPPFSTQVGYKTTKQSRCDPHDIIWSNTFAERRKSMQVPAWSPREKTFWQTTGNLVRLREDVSSKKISRGYSGLVAMELGCDYGHSSFILTKTECMFQFKVQTVQPMKMSRTFVTRIRVNSAINGIQASMSRSDSCQRRRTTTLEELYLVFCLVRFTVQLSSEDFQRITLDALQSAISRRPLPLGEAGKSGDNEKKFTCLPERTKI